LFSDMLWLSDLIFILKFVISNLNNRFYFMFYH